MIIKPKEEDIEPPKEENHGRTGWDILAGFRQWLTDWWHVLLLIALCFVLYYLFGWYALSGLIVGSGFSYLLARYFLTAEQVAIHEFDEIRGTWSTYKVGIDRFAEFEKDAPLSPVQSKKGNIVYLAENIDWKGNKISGSWMMGLSTFDYAFNLKVFGELKARFKDFIQQYNQNVIVPTIYGELHATDILHTFKNYLEHGDKTLPNLRTIDQWKEPTTPEEVMQSKQE